jgi:putative CocE/NonD family hydrolase
MFQLPVTFYFAAKGKEAIADPELEARLLEAWHTSEAWLHKLPLRQGATPLEDTPHIERWLLDMMTKSDYSDFWKSEPLWQVGEHVEDFADIPGLFMGSWFDVCRADTYFPLLAGKSANRKLIMGPWVHIDFEQVSGDVDFGETAALTRSEYMTLQKRWFDATLKEDVDAYLSEPSVRIFVMGGGSGRRTAAGHLEHGGCWRNETTWPPADVSYEQLYLGPGGNLTWNLSRADGGSSSYRYDPGDPVPTTGGTAFFFRDRTGDTFDLFVPLGAHDHRPVQGSNLFGTDGRDDVLTFQTAPLREAVEVTGPLAAEVWLFDTDLTVKLLDVYPPNDDYPDGYAMNLADGLLRLRYRDSFEKPTLLTPGTIYRVEVPSDIFGVTSNRFAAGHRIRLDISSSNFPAFDRNPNNGKLMTHDESQPTVTEVSIQHNGEYPSHVILPVIRRTGRR